MPMPRQKSSRRPGLALETTLLLHGVPRGEGLPLANELAAITRKAGTEPMFVGLWRGRGVVGLSPAQLAALAKSPRVHKANTANLGVFMHRREHAATTVSTTLELAHAAGLKVMATGGIGGVHRGYAARLDVSADLLALTRFPLAVVCSGVKSLLDVVSTREALETLGVPVIGWKTDRFPAFYSRDGGAGVDAVFEDIADLAGFCRAELTRTGRGALVVNPIAKEHEIPPERFERWLRRVGVRPGAGRGETPRVLAALHELSKGETLRANIALVRGNVALGAGLARAIARRG